MGRQETRAASFFQSPVVPIGITNDLEASGTLIDILDAAGGEEGVILVNVAPRNGRAKEKWPNGTPFAYFYYENTLVATSIDGHTLSLIKKLGIADSVHLMDIPTVMRSMHHQGKIKEDLVDIIANTQFRSFEFLPRVAKWIHEKESIPSETYSLSEVDDASHAVWFVDNFGNCKTTMLPEDVDFEAGKTIKILGEEVRCYDRLKDVDDKKPGLIIGSSGFRDKRFLELDINGGNASKHFGITSGSTIEI